jgi:hypothetical protein
MTSHRGPLSELDAHLAARCRSSEGRATMDRLRAAGCDLAGADTLDALVEVCKTTPDRGRAGEILAALVSLSMTDDLAGVVALVALGPALVRLARRLAAAGIDPRRAEGDVMAVAFEQLTVARTRMAHAGMPTCDLARTIVGKTWDRLRTELRADQRCALRRCRLDATDLPAAPTLAEATPGITGILTEAVATGAISAEAARIIHATRVERRSFRSLACELHKGEAALYKMRRRSERVLVERTRADRPGQGAG